MPYRPTRKYARVDSWTSSVTGNEGAMVDAGLSMGRSFRAGWGPGGRLVHLGSLCGPSSTPYVIFIQVYFVVHQLYAEKHPPTPPPCQYPPSPSSLGQIQTNQTVFSN